MRDIEVRAALAKGKPIAEIKAQFGLSESCIRLIAKRPAGKPRLMSRCEGCLKKRDESRDRVKAGTANYHRTPPEAQPAA